MSLIFALSLTEDYATTKKFNAASNFLESYLKNHTPFVAAIKKKKSSQDHVCLCVCVRAFGVGMGGGCAVLWAHMYGIYRCVMLCAQVH